MCGVIGDLVAGGIAKLFSPCDHSSFVVLSGSLPLTYMFLGIFDCIRDPGVRGYWLNNHIFFNTAIQFLLFVLILAAPAQIWIPIVVSSLLLLSNAYTIWRTGASDG